VQTGRQTDRQTGRKADTTAALSLIMTVSTENESPSRFAKTENSDSPVQIQM